MRKLAALSIDHRQRFRLASKRRDSLQPVATRRRKDDGVVGAPTGAAWKPLDRAKGDGGTSMDCHFLQSAIGEKHDPLAVGRHGRS